MAESLGAIVLDCVCVVSCSVNRCGHSIHSYAQIGAKCMGH